MIYSWEKVRVLHIYTSIDSNSESEEDLQEPVVQW